MHSRNIDALASLHPLDRIFCIFETDAERLSKQLYCFELITVVNETGDLRDLECLAGERRKIIEAAPGIHQVVRGDHCASAVAAFLNRRAFEFERSRARSAVESFSHKFGNGGASFQFLLS